MTPESSHLVHAPFANRSKERCKTGHFITRSSRLLTSSFPAFKHFTQVGKVLATQAVSAAIAWLASRQTEHLHHHRCCYRQASCAVHSAHQAEWVSSLTCCNDHGARHTCRMVCLGESQCDPSVIPMLLKQDMNVKGSQSCWQAPGAL